MCLCPASCNATVLEDFRRRFVEKGGTVGPAAAPVLDAADYAVLKVLLAFPLLVLGWWPFRRSRSKAMSKVMRSDAEIEDAKNGSVGL